VLEISMISIAFISGLLLQNTHLLDISALGIVLLLTASAGICTGMQFPIAHRILTSDVRNTGKNAGILYAADLAGSWVAGMIGSIVLIPVLGIAQALCVAALFKLSSAVILKLTKL
jgi:predicted membrane-bound spermidine synthase